ncbi:hypothetical protein RRG08_035334 [Elysia crispata]|uniref:Uncharacterized protein n=1 Tax=Elysia crispata TaxID=231223 RepID=A0AAE1CRW5_9GAST|nr:hypothetical protein RRG08_035334 [Elysia crispata]
MPRSHVFFKKEARLVLSHEIDRISIHRPSRSKVRQNPVSPQDSRPSASFGITRRLSEVLGRRSLSHVIPCGLSLILTFVCLSPAACQVSLIAFLALPLSEFRASLSECKFTGLVKFAAARFDATGQTSRINCINGLCVQKTERINQSCKLKSDLI